MNYAAEISPIHVPFPADARMFVLLIADTDAKAVDAVRALGALRTDKVWQIDLHRRDPNGGRETTIWSGLSRVQTGRPKLQAIG